MSVTPSTDLQSSKSSLDTDKLTLLESITLSVILEDALDHLAILEFIEKHNPDVAVNLEYQSVMDRVKEFTNKTRQKDMDAINPVDRHSPYIKLQCDRAYLQEAFLRTKTELKENRTFCSLLNTVNCHNAMKDDVKKLMEEKKRNHHTMIALQRQLHNQKLEAEHNIQCVNEVIAKKRDTIEDILFENALRIRYVENWEQARAEQNAMICEKSETELSDAIACYHNEIEKEIRIDAEIVNYISENRKDMEESIEMWMDKYDEDLEKRQMDIQIFKEKREDLQIEYEKLTSTFEEQRQQIQEYQEHKIQKQREEEHLAMLNEKATKIQAWWRGLMVRLKLGPFNPNRGKKGKKGKGKDKKSGKIKKK